jgi:hypothetical protein
MGTHVNRRTALQFVERHGIVLNARDYPPNPCPLGLGSRLDILMRFNKSS